MTHAYYLPENKQKYHLFEVYRCPRQIYSLIDNKMLLFLVICRNAENYSSRTNSRLSHFLPNISEATQVLWTGMHIIMKESNEECRLRRRRQEREYQLFLHFKGNEWWMALGWSCTLCFVSWKWQRTHCLLLIALFYSINVVFVVRSLLHICMPDDVSCLCLVGKNLIC